MVAASDTTAGALPDGTASVVSFRTDSGIRLPGEDRLNMAVDLHFPKELAQPAIALICLPGGSVNRHFFDLMPPADDPMPDDASFSFARQMTARGFIVALVDHLGIGDSARPQDGFALSTEILAQAAAHVLADIKARIQAHYGAAAQGLCTVGVGHSMGGTITTLQQAQYHSHRALALLGFSTRGLPEYLPPQLKALANDPSQLRAQLPMIARAMFKEAYTQLERTPQSRGIFAGDRADPRGIAAFKAAGTAPNLPLPGCQSMLPGNVAPEAAAIDVPVFLGVGERDIVGPPADVPAAFSGSPRVELLVMPETGHSHFLFQTRLALFEVLAVWIRSACQAQA
jgi:pimeloyl-ACP methyl ester carboxylesterase